MRKLSKEEAEAIPSKLVGKNSLARAILMRMEVGDIILMEPHEWKQRKHPPSELIRRMRKTDKRDYTCNTALDGSGWIIERLK